MLAPVRGQAIRLQQIETDTSSWLLHFKFVDYLCSYDVLTLHGEGLVSTTALLVHLHYKYLVGRDCELVEHEYSTLILVARNSCGIVIGTQRENDLLLNGCTLHHLLIHNLEGHEVHLVRYIRCVLHLRMEV